MAYPVIMPKQGLQMTEGTILNWLVPEGQDCIENEPLFEIETDKLAITIDAPASGKLLKILYAEGETVPITTIIALIGEEGEDISGFSKEVDKKAGEEKTEISKDTSAEPLQHTKDRILASPRARMLAEESGVKLENIKGSGTDGYINEKDVIEYLRIVPGAVPMMKSETESISESQTQPYGRTRLIPFTGMRKTIAVRMLDSLHRNAQAVHRIRVDMSKAELMHEAFARNGSNISFNDIIAYAVCKALIKHPRMNSELTGEGILEKDYVNLGIAVALKDGLVVPVVKNADFLSLPELSAAIKLLTKKAKEGSLSSDEFSNGSFTISNLGMMGIDDFTAIINPPESGILAVGRVEKTPVVANSEIMIRPLMSLTLSYDHRVIDGAQAAGFLMEVKTWLENP